MEDRRIHHITQQLSQNLARHWTMHEMADLVRLSVSGLKRLFSEEIGIPPMTYLHDLRLEKAAEFLADPECFLQIKEIGCQVGLLDGSHLTRDFKRKFSLTPTEFREKAWRIHNLDSPDGHP